MERHNREKHQPDECDMGWNVSNSRRRKKKKKRRVYGPPSVLVTGWTKVIRCVSFLCCRKGIVILRISDVKPCPCPCKSSRCPCPDPCRLGPCPCRSSPWQVLFHNLACNTHSIVLIVIYLFSVTGFTVIMLWTFNLCSLLLLDSDCRFSCNLQ